MTIEDSFMNDTEVEPLERETNISFSSEGDTMRIFAAHKSMMENLWSHTYADVDALSVRENGRYYRIQPSEHDGENIVGLWAEAPIGLLKLKSSPRSNNWPSGVVSNQEEVSFDS